MRRDFDLLFTAAVLAFLVTGLVSAYLFAQAERLTKHVDLFKHIEELKIELLKRRY